MLAAVPTTEGLTDTLRDAVASSTPLLQVLAIAIGAILAVRLGHWVVTAWWNRRRDQDPTSRAQIARSKAQRTRASVLRSLITYTVSAGAVVAIAAVASGGAIPAAIGIGVLVIIVGWGLNRVLADMIAGGLLLFERQYRVGDYLILPGNDVAGVVEEFALRTTVLRSFNGDRITVLNGSIEEIVKVEDGYRDFEVELFVPAARLEQARSRVERVCARLRAYHQNLFLTGPALVEARSLEGRRVSHLRIRAVVPPSLEWLAERTLPAQLEHELGGLVVGPIHVFNLDASAFDEYLHQVVLPRFQAQEGHRTGEIPLVATTSEMRAIPGPPPS